MDRKLTMVYWKGDRFWLGKLLEHPEIMTQGETLATLADGALGYTPASASTPPANLVTANLTLDYAGTAKIG